jgi:hypothetical protein
MLIENVSGTSDSEIWTVDGAVVEELLGGVDVVDIGE